MASIADAMEQIKRNPRGVIDPTIAEVVCQELGMSWRNTPLAPPNTLALLLQQVLHGNLSMPELVRKAGMDVTPEAYCTARGRLPLEVVREMSRRICDAAMPVADQSGQDDWRGHRVWHEDGSSFSMPDTPELRKHFGQPPRQQSGCGFPVAHIFCLFSANTGLVREVVVSPLRTHDLAKTPLVKEHLCSGDIQIGDTAFSSYFHLASLRQGGVHAIFPVHQGRIVCFRHHRSFSHSHARDRVKGQPTSRWVKSLGECDQIVEYFKPRTRPVRLSVEEYKRMPPSILVRELRRRICRYGRSKVVTISTTLLDAESYPADEIVKLLEGRWNVEVNLRHLKTTMKMEVLRCQSAEGVQKELWAFILIYNLVRVIMMAAASRQQVELSRISFANALYWMRHAKPDSPMPDLIVNPYRPDRVEPRAVKRRPKEYDRLNKPRDVLRKRLRGRKKRLF